MRVALALLILSIIPNGLGAAEIAAVTSGEHEDYTRLVFTISPNNGWDLDVGDRSSKLVFPLDNLKFEDENVFARIPKTRLISVGSIQQGNTTEYLMGFGCNCDVKAFSYLDAYVVVDISDPAPPIIVNSDHVAPELVPSAQAGENYKPPEFISWALPIAPTYRSSREDVDFPQQIDEGEILGLASIQEPDEPPIVTQENYSILVNGDSEIEEKSNGSGVSVQEAVDVARDSLLHQLTLAADQGLLELSEPMLAPEHVAPNERIVETKEILAEQLETEDENQVLIQTVYSRDSKLGVSNEVLGRSYCPSNEYLDIASWGSGTDFFGDLSGTRKRLLKEFDKIDVVELERLAQVYIRYGFGAEAISYLSNSNLGSKRKHLLLDLAAIVDSRPARPDGPFSKAVNCNGLAGLWALIGNRPKPEEKIEARLQLSTHSRIFRRTSGVCWGQIW